MNSAARMPQYSWNQDDLDAVTTALLKPDRTEVHQCVAASGGGEDRTQLPGDG